MKFNNKFMQNSSVKLDTIQFTSFIQTNCFFAKFSTSTNVNGKMQQTCSSRRKVLQTGCKNCEKCSENMKNMKNVDVVIRWEIMHLFPLLKHSFFSGKG